MLQDIEFCQSRCRAGLVVVVVGLGASGCVRGGFDSVDSDGRLLWTTRGDFEAAGSTRSNLDTVAEPGAMVLGAAAAEAMVVGPPTTGPVGSGAHGLSLPDGRMLIVHGEFSDTTSYYDPVTRTMAPGPRTSGPASTALVDQGGLSLRRPDGTFLIIHGVGTWATSIFDPTTGSMRVGPKPTCDISADPYPILRDDGSFLVVCGNGTPLTTVYDPVGNTFADGLRTSDSAGRGTFAIARPDGSYLIIHGSRSSTTLYEPADEVMTSGPELTAAPSAGAHAFERPDGTYVIVHGDGALTSSIYRPATNVVEPGPVFPSGATIWNGSFALQRCDGATLIFAGEEDPDSYIYDPVTNEFSVGPLASGGLETGSFARQSPVDGTYLIVHGGFHGDTSTSIYDAGCPLVGTYTSEPVEISEGQRFTTLGWDQGADSGIAVAVRVAQSAAELESTAYAPIDNGALVGDVIPTPGRWLQLRIDYSRPLPDAPGGQAKIHRGRAWNHQRQRLSRPTVAAWWVDHE